MSAGLRSRYPASNRAIRVSLIMWRAIRSIDWRQRQGAIRHHLNRRAARAEQQDRPECRIDAHADDHFVRAWTADHRLHHEAVDLRAGPDFDDAVQHFLRGHFGRVRALDAEAHAADIGFMRNIGRQNFDDAGGVFRQKPLGPDANVLRIGCNVTFRDRDAGGFQHRLGFNRRQHRFARQRRRR